MSRRGVSSPESSDQRAKESQELRLPLKDRRLGEGRAPAGVPRVGLKITAGLPNASAFVSVSAEMHCLHWRPQNETQQRGFECKYLMCLLILIGAWRRKTGGRQGRGGCRQRASGSKLSPRRPEHGAAGLCGSRRRSGPSELSHTRREGSGGWGPSPPVSIHHSSRAGLPPRASSAGRVCSHSQGGSGDPGRSTRLGDTGRTPRSLGCVMVSPASRRCCDDGRGNDYTPLGVLSGGSKNVNVGGKRIGSHS